MTNNFYVYILFDAFAIPRYVGKGRGNRWLRHERESCPSNWMKNEFVEQTRRMLSEVPKIKIAEGLAESDAFAMESLLIQAIGRHPIGPLVNMTDGGEGTAGHSLSESHRMAISLARKGRPFSEQHRANLSIAQKNREYTAEQQAKRLSGLRQCIGHSEETRAKMSRALRGRKIEITPLMRAAYEARKGRKLPEAQRAKMSEAQKMRWGRGPALERNAKISATKRSMAAVMVTCPECGCEYKTLGLGVHRFRKHSIALGYIEAHRAVANPATAALGLDDA